MGATVKLTASVQAACLKIPGGQHSTGEMIDYANAANVVDGSIQVGDPSGRQVCLGASLALRQYQPAVTYTALMLGTGKADTHHLVRRDVSRTAHCAAPASTAPGGPSTALSLTSAIYAASWSAQN